MELCSESVLQERAAGASSLVCTGLKRLIDEYQLSFQGKKKTKSSEDNKLYKIEIVEVDKENKKVKIHFKGYHGHDTHE